MKKLAMILFVSFIAVSAGAANWVAAVEDPEKGTYFYVDTESISTQGNYKQSFVKFINIPEEFYMVSLSSYDCRSNPRRIKFQHSTMFDLRGNVISPSSMTKSHFSPVFPDSPSESIINFVCKF